MHSIIRSLISLLLSYGDGFAGMVSYRSIRFVYSGGRCDI